MCNFHINVFVKSDNTITTSSVQLQQQKKQLQGGTKQQDSATITADAIAVPNGDLFFQNSFTIRVLLVSRKFMTKLRIASHRKCATTLYHVSCDILGTFLFQNVNGPFMCNPVNKRCKLCTEVQQ